MYTNCDASEQLFRIIDVLCYDILRDCKYTNNNAAGFTKSNTISVFINIRTRSIYNLLSNIYNYIMN